MTQFLSSLIPILSTLTNSSFPFCLVCYMYQFSISFIIPILSIVCLFDLILLLPINNLSVIKGQVFLGRTSTKLGLMCLTHGHNAVTPVRLDPVAPRSPVKHSTTEPLRSHHFIYPHQLIIPILSVCYVNPFLYNSAFPFYLPSPTHHSYFVWFDI